jgi:hypothetical protein
MFYICALLAVAAHARKFCENDFSFSKKNLTQGKQKLELLFSSAK